MLSVTGNRILALELFACEPYFGPDDGCRFDTTPARKETDD